MNWKFFTLCGVWMSIIIYSASCTQDQVVAPEPCTEVKSYNESIRDILRYKCNTSGCHDGSSGVGNYNSFSGIARVVENGEFRQEVIVEKTMPKDGSLTDEEFTLLKCWSENGYPED
jgi:hypothetical protein